MVLERGAFLNNRYKIVEILGQGGMGSVYRAIDENLGVEVAVKDNLFTSDEYERQFRREALILANLRHANLPRVTDHFVIHGQGQYLVMDYIEGEDLRQRMERIGIIPEEEVITIGAAVCEALAYLSSRKPSIVHRDIKPGNVKITPQGEIFLVDFGLAKTLEGSQETTSGARAMTPGYSPPEQYGTARTDERTDIYSLGATLYAALTGATPEDALARAMDQADLTPIRRYNQKVSRKLSSVIEKALEVHPDDRFQSADEFKQALLSASSISRKLKNEYMIPPPPGVSGEYLGDSETSYSNLYDINKADGLAGDGVKNVFSDSPVKNGAKAYPVKQNIIQTPKPRPRRRSKAMNIWRFIQFGLLFFLAGAVVLFFFIPGELRPEFLANAYGKFRSDVFPATSTITPNADQIQGTEMAVSLPSQMPSITPSPTATREVKPTDVIAAQPSPTIVFTDTPTPLPTPVGGGSGKLAFASDTTGIPQVYYISSAGGEVTQVTNMPEGACQPDWSPDGLRMVFISPCDDNGDYYPFSAMYIINIDGTGLLPLPTVSGGDFDPAWSPDGKQIAFTSLRNNNRIQIYLFNLEDNSVIPLSEKYSFDMQPAWSTDGKKIVFVSTRRGNPQIWVMDRDGKNQELFSHSPGLRNYNPNWSADGTKILFTQYITEGGIPRAMFAEYHTDNYIEYRVGQELLPMREAVYSPDGYWIAYEGWLAGTGHDIHIVSASGAARQQLTTDPRLEFDPAWCPAP